MRDFRLFYCKVSSNICSRQAFTSLQTYVVYSCVSNHIDNPHFNIRYRLNDLQGNIDAQGKIALENAWKRAEIAGQQSDRMTEIAHEARELADQIETQADDIDTKAANAKNGSIQAYNTVRNATNKQDQISEEARGLRHDITNIENKLNKVSYSDQIKFFCMESYMNLLYNLW